MTIVSNAPMNARFIAPDHYALYRWINTRLGPGDRCVILQGTSLASETDPDFERYVSFEIDLRDSFRIYLVRDVAGQDSGAK